MQYIGYCSDEVKRTSKKLYSYYDVEYPLVDAGITTDDALQICNEYGFDFGGVYKHHSHFNCWLCPLQRVNELKTVYERFPNYWSILRKLQESTCGYYKNELTIFDFEKRFWLEKQEQLRLEMLKNRSKYSKKKKKIK